METQAAFKQAWPEEIEGCDFIRSSSSASHKSYEKMQYLLHTNQALIHIKFLIHLCIVKLKSLL